MYKVLIVDNEEPVRQAIRILGMWEELGVDSVLEASNGQAALEILRNNTPDIVLLDMRMPIMDGATFLNIAKKEFPQIKCIVISGYGDYEYTRQAIQNKTLDYLLKPIIANELNSALNIAVSELSKESSLKETDLNKTILNNMAMPLIKEKFMSFLVDGQPSALFDKNFKKVIKAEEEEGFFYVAILKILNFHEVNNKKFSNDNSLTFFAFCNVVDELLMKWCSPFSFKNAKSTNEIIIVISSNDNEKDLPSNRLILSLIEITNKLEDLFNAYSVISIGSPHKDMTCLHESYLKAESILNSINILSNKNNTVFTESETSNHLERLTLIDSRELLINAFERGSKELALSIIKEYLEKIRETGYFSIQDFRKTVLEFSLIIEDISLKFGIPKLEGMSKFNLEFFESNINRFEDFIVLVCNIIESVFDNISNSLYSNDRKVVNKIKEYIDQNYFKDISLNMFSEKYFLGKEYLTKLYKEEYGYGIYEYVLKVRMKIAKNMLDDPNAKIQAISQKVGYQDNNYFSKAFKKYYGLSPSEYRSTKTPSESENKSTI